ncbi:MAG: DUF3570 domain-containing protein [Methyloglobulus sp.]|nr:DUF3570 domain-containing protein [Methyloglobulus sp.]
MGVISRKAKKPYLRHLIKSFDRLRTNGNLLSSVALSPFVVSLSNHERTQLANRLLKKPECASLQALTAAALILPGLFQPTAKAAEDDSVDFQYNHYQEGKRDGINLFLTNKDTSIASKYAYAIPKKRNPIEVDSLHGSARVSLTDRVKFAFNYIEDTWSGATPFGSAPEQSGANGGGRGGTTFLDGKPIISGATPIARSNTYLDGQGNSFYKVTDPITGQSSFLKDRAVHVLGYASPETRKQGDFKLSYEWDEAALNMGGGISIERDYESRFVNLGGRMDFNQKQTTVNLGLSYTNSAISAVIDPSAFHWTSKIEENKLITHNPITSLNTLNSNREDWAAHLDLTQVINPNTVMGLGMGYTRSTGYLANPYKFAWIYGVDPNLPDPIFEGLPTGIFKAHSGMFLEQRPDVRNQWNWSARWTQYLEPLNAAVHVGYSFAHDDWGINAHTFEGDWVQPLGAGWTVTPRIRYYSQEAADFYQPIFKVNATIDHLTGTLDVRQLNIPDNFSSDQRLSGYGALSGGVTVAKEFAKGIGLEAGFEYYTHQGSLKLGGGGEQAFADFDYWVANAALKVNLSALGQGGASGGGGHGNHNDHPNIPAGILFAHTLDKAGDMMVGYRHNRAMQGGDYLHGTQHVGEPQVVAQGCPGSPRQGSVGQPDGCSLLPGEMAMTMHMLELMVAPTDWLTLMLMPQFMDMAMEMDMTMDNTSQPSAHAALGHRREHETGGIGDTGMYALVKLFDTPQHHIHASLGFSAPTGDVGIRRAEGGNYSGPFIDYGMQLGSGTWDFKPSLTYTGKANDWSWGAQVGGIKRLEGSNQSGYALGDLFETSVWGGYDLTRWLSATIRASYTWQGVIKGRYPRRKAIDASIELQCKIQSTDPDSYDEFGVLRPSVFHPDAYKQCLIDSESAKQLADAADRPSPSDFPANYGGHYGDIGFGLSATVPTGALAGNKLSFEWLQPVYTDVNGYQLDRDGALSFTWSYGF